MRHSTLLRNRYISRLLIDSRSYAILCTMFLCSHVKFSVLCGVVLCWRGDLLFFILGALLASPTCFAIIVYVSDEFTTVNA